MAKANFNSAQKATFDLFGGNPTGETQPDSASDEFRVGRPEKIQQIGIFEIVPDASQPRRALPSAIRAEWNGDPVNLPGLFGDWLAWVGEAFRNLIMAILDGQEIERPEEIEEPEIAALVEIATLAGSIKRDGLMNAITVAKIPGGGYQIESGERRWLAYHLLHHTQGKPFATIPARTVERVDRWRQAAENNTRSDLNAIGKARQFAVLLMDLIGWEQFRPFDEFEHEQGFYSQVADGEAYRIPRGAGERLVAALGLKNGQQLRAYRGLLRLPNDLWKLADDQNWPESVIRQHIAADTVSIDTVSDDSTHETPEDGDLDTPPVVHPVFKKFDRQANWERRQAKQMDRETRNKLALMHEELAKQLRSMK
jgi:hypothetical protein